MLTKIDGLVYELCRLNQERAVRLLNNPVRKIAGWIASSAWAWETVSTRVTGRGLVSDTRGVYTIGAFPAEHVTMRSSLLDNSEIKRTDLPGVLYAGRLEYSLYQGCVEERYRAHVSDARSEYTGLKDPENHSVKASVAAILQVGRESQEMAGQHVPFSLNNF